MGNKQNRRKSNRVVLNRLRKQTEQMRELIQKKISLTENEKSVEQEEVESPLPVYLDLDHQYSPFENENREKPSLNKNDGTVEQKEVESPLPVYLDLDHQYSPFENENRKKRSLNKNDESVEQEEVESPSSVYLDLDHQYSPPDNEERPRKLLKAKRRSHKTPTSSLPTCSGINFEQSDNVVDDSQIHHTILGHRVIDVKCFFEDLVKASSHESLFKCGLNTMQLINEKQCGFSSVFLVCCVMCKKEFKIRNTSENLNKMVVAGTMASGCGHAQLKQISAALDLPLLSDHKYRVLQDEVSDEWEVTAWEEMRKAGERERQMALEEGRINKEGIPIIDVVLDGCWSKRSYRTNYSALSGAAAIIGRRSGQVLFLAVKNKYCCICARAEKRNETVKHHECFKNFSGSSTSMESTIIAEGFKLSIEMHGVIYGKFVADGDSSTYAKILESRPYPSDTVEKIGCKNHILRNFCNKMQMLKSDTKYSVAERKTLTNEKLMLARKYIHDSIIFHNSSELPHTENIKKLHHDINYSMHHAFGSHHQCNKIICSEQTQNEETVTKILNSHIFQRIRYLTGNVASQARSLIENVDSNVVERFNGVIAKFVGGKRVNYTLKRSYQARCAGAVISINSGKILTTVHRNMHNTSPLAKIKKYEEDKEIKREYNRTIRRKKNRTLFTKRINKDYGEYALKPDMDKETFELAKTAFLKSLEKTQNERNDIEQRTILQSDSGEWLELRRNLLTASNFGKVVKRKKTNTCSSIVKNMVYRPNIDHVASINHGRKYEKIALEQVARSLNIEIKQCGLFIDEYHCFLGATPDGITNDMVVEIKCPIAPFKIGLETAIQNGKMHFWRINKKTGQIFVNEKSDWYIQAQGQMHICKKDKCLLVVWYGDKKFKTEILNKDDKFWKEKMEPNLLTFYFDCLLPELVDPRLPRHQPIRDPEYVIKKKERNMNKENVDPHLIDSKTAEERVIGKTGNIIENEITEVVLDPSML